MGCAAIMLPGQYSVEEVDAITESKHIEAWISGGSAFPRKDFRDVHGKPLPC